MKVENNCVFEVWVTFENKNEEETKIDDILDKANELGLTWEQPFSDGYIFDTCCGQTAERFANWLRITRG